MAVRRAGFSTAEDSRGRETENRGRASEEEGSARGGAPCSGQTVLELAGGTERRIAIPEVVQKGSRRQYQSVPDLVVDLRGLRGVAVCRDLDYSPRGWRGAPFSATQESHLKG